MDGSDKELDQEMSDIIRRHHGFLNKKAAKRLIAIENRIPLSIEDAESINRIVTIKASVERVWQTANYRSGSRSRAIKITDGRKRATLVLWNQHADIARYLKKGDEILADGIFKRNGEFHLTKKGEISLSKRAETIRMDQILNYDNMMVHVRGKIDRIEEKGNGVIISITDGRGNAECMISGRMMISEGDEVILDSAVVRRGKLIIPDEGRILVKQRN